MADIFVSYQRDDEKLARRIVAALVGDGLTVWWDDEATSREQWDMVLEREIAAAKAVLVLWTPSAVKSKWVRIEANYAATCVPSKLVQARFSNCSLPIAFSLTQYADIDWNRPTECDGWRRIRTWIDQACAEGPGAQPYERRPGPRQRAQPNLFRRLLLKHRARRDRLEAAMPSLNRTFALVAMCLGVLLFCLNGLFGLKFKSGLDAEFSFLFTPLFALPLGIELWRQKQIRWLGAVYFILGLTLAHLAANMIGSSLYEAGGTTQFLPCGGFFGDQNDPVIQACWRNLEERRERQALQAGFAGGLVGATLSFAGLMLVARRFHSRRRLAMMLAGTIMLGLLGGAGFSFATPSDMKQAAWVFQVFLPWQLVFGTILVLLFDCRLMADVRIGGPRHDE